MTIKVEREFLKNLENSGTMYNPESGIRFYVLRGKIFIILPQEKYLVMTLKEVLNKIEPILRNWCEHQHNYAGDYYYEWD